MKRFSGVVRYAHKLTRYEAGIEKTGRKKRRIFCHEVRVDTARLDGNFDSCRDVVVAWKELAYADDSVETLMNLITVLRGSSVSACVVAEWVSDFPNDVRGWLCDEVAVRVLLRRLDRHWESALNLLGLEVSVREELLFDFGLEVLYATRVLPWTGVAGDEFDLICERWEMIGGEDVAGLILAYSSITNVVDWFEMFIRMDAISCERAVREWLHHSAFLNKNNGQYGDLMEMVLRLDGQEGFEGLLGTVMSQIADGSAVDRLICLIEISRGFGINFPRFSKIGDGCVDSELLSRVAVMVKNRRIARRLFFSGMSDDEIKSLDLFLYTNELKGKRGEELVDLVVNEIDNCRIRKFFGFDWLLGVWGEVYGSLDEEYLSKAYNLSYYCYPNHDDLKRGELVVEICKRLLGRGMARSSDVDEFVNMVEDREDLAEYVALPDAIWRKIDHLMRSRNRADSFKQGYRRLVSVDGGFVLKGLRVSAGVMLKLCEEIGGCSDYEWEEVKEWFEYHPLLNGGVKELSELVRRYGDEYGDVAMPVKLFDMVSNGVRLRKEVYDSECLKLDRAQVRILSLEVGRYLNVILNRYSGGLLDSHTVRISKGLGHNKRIFRKVLKKVGERGGYSTSLHPNNLKWMKTRKRFWRPGVWLTGVRDEVVVEGAGRVIFQSEHHFEEVLKMGTLVQSCLSIGGCNQHSAIANALDVNKQVIFVRDENGKFLARQLLAMTESGELACFDVYHASDGGYKKLLEAHFLRLNFEFAKRLGVNVCKQDDYEVARVVCSDWYDDGLWDDAISQAG